MSSYCEQPSPVLCPGYVSRERISCTGLENYLDWVLQETDINQCPHIRNAITAYYHSKFLCWCTLEFHSALTPPVMRVMNAS